MRRLRLQHDGSANMGLAKKADSILSRIGLNPAMTGDPLGRGFPGAMTMMVVRSLVSNAAHTIGKNGGQPRSGSGNPKPNTPNAPRSGGSGGISSGTAASHTNAYHHSAAAQQTGAGAVSAQETASVQTAAMQADTVQSAAEKTADAFPQAAPAGIGKQPNATRKTAVPPSTRRAPGHVAAAKNHVEAPARKTAPGAPYHQAGMARLSKKHTNGSFFQAPGIAGTKVRTQAGTKEKRADALSSPRHGRNRAYGSWDHNGRGSGGAEAFRGQGGKKAVRSADRQNAGVYSVAS